VKDQPAQGGLDNEAPIVTGRAQKMPKKSLDLQTGEQYVTPGGAAGATQRRAQNTEKGP
jgi:hypothetical protein